MISVQNTNKSYRKADSGGSLRRLINNRIAIPQSSERDGIQHWQDRILFILLSIGVYLGFFVYVPSVALSLFEQLWSVAIADTVIYLWVILLYFKPKLSFKIRACSVVTLSYLLGITLLLTIGPYGAGPVWLFLFPVITGLFFDLRFTLLSLLINLVTIIGLGLVIYFNIYSWQGSTHFPFSSWIIIGSNFILLDIIVAVAIVSLLTGLQRSLLLEKDALTSIEQKNLELRESNRKLQKVIDDRDKIEAELLKSEKALKRSELLFRDLVNLLPLPYFLVNTDFTINYANFKAVETFKLSRDQSGTLRLKSALNLIAPEDQLTAKNDFQQMIEQMTSGWEHYTGITETGERLPIEILLSTVKINEKLVGAQGVIIDKTERLAHQRVRKEKQVAEQTNKAISEWVDFVVHELRTPLSGLLQFAQLGLKKLSDPAFYSLLEELKSDFDDSGPDKLKSIAHGNNHCSLLMEQVEERDRRLTKYFSRIHSGGYRLQRLLNELLDLSKLETNKMSFTMKPTNFLEVIQEACNEVEASLEAHQILLEIHSCGIKANLVCDPFRMGQVIRNLLSNAIKFSKPGGEISILFQKMTVESSDNPTTYLQTSITDEGVGIPAEELEEVFLKFRQSRKSRVGEGSGLGLPICRQIISAHQGKIWAESSLGAGTQIHFLLPYPKQDE